MDQAHSKGCRFAGHSVGQVVTSAPGVRRAVISRVQQAQAFSTQNRLPGSEVGTKTTMELLLIPLVLTGVFLMPFALARLEPKPEHDTTHRAEARRIMPR